LGTCRSMIPGVGIRRRAHAAKVMLVSSLRLAILRGNLE